MYYQFDSIYTFIKNGKKSYASRPSLRITKIFLQHPTHELSEMRGTFIGVYRTTAFADR